jgi:hypothetical protein
MAVISQNGQKRSSSKFIEGYQFQDGVFIAKWRPKIKEA